MLRGLFVVLLVIIVLAVVGDFVARAVAEQRVADSMQRELDLREEPNVDIDAVPFIADLVEGSIDSVTIEAEGLQRGDIRLESTEVRFRDVEFSLGQLLSGDHRRVSIGSGRGTARFTDDDLTDALEEQDTPARVQFRDGAAFVTSDELRGEVEAELTIEDGSLTVLTPAGSQPGGIELPEFGGDVTYEGVEVRGSEGVLTFTIGERTVEL
jgi:hypothetical protein